MISKKPLVTVVTATFNLYENNRINTFIQSIESVRNQSYSNIEHLIIDGASTDGTLQFLKVNFENEKTRIVSEPDSGIWDAINKGSKLANGLIVNFMNTDDYFLTFDAIEKAVTKFEEEGIDWYFSDSLVERSDGSTYEFPTSSFGVFVCQGIVHQSMWVKRELLLAVDAFNNNHVTRENYFMMQLLINNFKFYHEKECLVVYREGGFSASEYGGSNFQRTKEDFGTYFYNLCGETWGMSVEECTAILGFHCFTNEGILRSIRIGMKLKYPGLRSFFMKKLIIHVRINYGLKGIVKGFFRTIARIRIRMELK